MTGLMNSEWMTTITTFVTQHIAPTVTTNPIPVLLVAAFIAINVTLYGFTRGREFLFAGYSGLLFLLPFIRLG